jgi:nucleoside-diphosphate-sugar epimerase
MIFILGGHGLVGSAFARVCERSKKQFSIIDRQNYKDHVGLPCDLFVNANGNSRKPLAKSDPLADFDASVRSVRVSLVDFRYEKYIHLSSCDVYPDCSTPQVTMEDQSLDPALQSPYGCHKFLAEQCVRHAAKEWIVFRLGGFVGPGLKKNAVFDILNGGPLWLQPESALQFLHTDDAARIIFDLADRGISREALNLCGSGLVRLSEVMEWVGNDVPVKPGSPLVRYDVSLDKIAGLTTIPDTRAAVREFVRAELRRRTPEGNAAK